MIHEKQALITVGTTQFQSLIKSTDTQQFVSLLRRNGYTKIIYQIGKGKYQPNHGQHFRLTPHINQYYDKADLMITHGGAGTLLQNLHKGKVMIAIANEELSGNHQTELIQILNQQGYILGFSSITKFVNEFQIVQKFIKEGPISKFTKPQRSIMNQIIFQQQQVIKKQSQDSNKKLN